MAGGKVVRAMQRREWDFSTLGSLAVQDILVSERIDGTSFRQCTLCVRIHESSFKPGAGQTIEVFGVADGYTMEDPSITFSASPSATVIINEALSENYVCEFLNDRPFGGLVRMVIRGTQGQSAGDTMTATLSADFVFKD